MKASSAKFSAGSVFCLEGTARPIKLSRFSLTQSTHCPTTILRGPAFAPTRCQTWRSFVRVNGSSYNGRFFEAFSSVAPSGLAEESETDEKETLEHLVRSVDSASESEIDDLTFEEEEEEDHNDEMIQVKADGEDESLLLKNYGLSEQTLKALEKRNITALFPIQKHVFEPAMKGRDLIGRAKTGSGKTLAFAIPIVENLLQENKQTGRQVRGRPPRAIVITPTRELANQVCKEFQSICPDLIVKPFYGGVSVLGNREALSKGIDVAVGTPGRIMDLVEQRALDLSMIRFAILDESDQMLDMGFEEDMEKILAYTPKEKQTMLFSATLPAWVRKAARKYLTNQLIVDLLGDEGTGKISDTIKALGILVQGNAKRKMLGDLLSTYAAGKKSIVFTQTKMEADAVHMVANRAVSSAVLHGDIAQNSREKTLERFRNSNFSCLVATDVAARGLDIPSVDLVLHYDCPHTHESFVHRSGRTGRAGKNGTTLVMVTKQEIPSFHKIVRASQTDIEMIGPPNPRDVMQASTKNVLEQMGKVTPEVMQFFHPAAEKLLEKGDGPQVLAAALATISGFSRVPKSRSLLTQQEGYVTIRILGKPGRIQGFGGVMHVLSELLGKNVVSGEFGQHEMIQDPVTQMSGVMIDAPSNVALQLLENASIKNEKLTGILVDRPKALTLDQIAATCPPDRGSNRNSRYGNSQRYGGYRNNRFRSNSGNNDRFFDRSNEWSDGDDGDWGDDDIFGRKPNRYDDRRRNRKSYDDRRRDSYDDGRADRFMDRRRRFQRQDRRFYTTDDRRSPENDLFIKDSRPRFHRARYRDLDW